MHNFKEIRSKSTFITEIKNLYEYSFPADERRDFNLVIDLLEQNPDFGIRVCTDSEKSELHAFVSHWNSADFHYIEHLAVATAMRGKGIGHSVMEDFIAHVGSRIVLEVEPPVDVLTRKRISFYESLGFKLNADFKYIQPPYSKHLNAIELRLMTRCDFSKEEIEAAANKIKSSVYPSL